MNGASLFVKVMGRIFPRYLIREIFINGAAIFGAVVICGIIIFLLGENPFRIYSIFFDAAFGSLTGFAYTLFYTTPLIFTGLAVGIGFRGGLFNIGAEGQLYMGAFAAAWVGFTFTALPGWLLIPLAICAAALMGGIWGWIPGYLKGRFGSHEVINTIMMNFIAVGILGYFVSESLPFREPGDLIPETLSISEHAHLPLLADIFSRLGINIPKTTPLNVSFFLAILAAIIIYILLWKTVLGYTLRVCGASPSAAQTAGIKVARITAVTMAISGALAGLVGVNEVLGYRHRFLFNFSPGYGFMGIAIALMGKNHPFGIVVSALIFGAIMRGGLMVDIYSDTLSKDIMYVFQGIIILFIGARMLGGFIRKK